LPATGFRLSIDIQAAPEAVFDYLTDFSRHGEWSANPLTIEQVSKGPVGVGSRFRSRAEVNGLHIEAEFELTDFQRPLLIAFAGKDSTGKYAHRFKIKPNPGGTHLVRTIRFELSLRQWLIYQVLLYPVRIPAGRKALRLLKARMEKQP